MHEIKVKDLTTSHALRENFTYTHSNPYHDRLGEYSDFVLRDLEAEEFKGQWNQKIFGKEAPLHLEIGSGYGEFMLNYCEHHPDIHFVGLDYRFKRSYQLAKKLDSLPYRNFRYLRAKGERLEYLFNENELDVIHYYFPDPWPKKRHHKKRLFQGPFLKAASFTLRTGGLLYVKTDHDGYYEWMKEQLQKAPYFKILLDTADLRTQHPDHHLAHFMTKFEKIFVADGIRIKALVLENCKNATR